MDLLIFTRFLTEKVWVTPYRKGRELMKVLLAPIFTIAMMSGPSNFAVNVNNLYNNPSKANVAKLFDLTVLRDVMEQTIEVKKSVHARNKMLNDVLKEIDG